MTARTDDFDFPAIVDKLVLFDVWFDVRVRLMPDGEHLALCGNRKAVACAAPMPSRSRPPCRSNLSQ